LLDTGVQISMDDRGQAFDNIFSERLWRTVRLEEVYLRDYQTITEARFKLGRYFEFYNNEILYEALGYCGAAEVYDTAAGIPVALRPTITIKFRFFTSAFYRLPKSVTAHFNKLLSMDQTYQAENLYRYILHTLTLKWRF
jgi:hypothetical protein